MPPNFSFQAVNTSCLATMKIGYDFNRFFEGRRFVKLLFERKLINAMDGNVPHVAVSTEEALEMPEPASMDESIVSDEILSIRLRRVVWT